MRALDRKVLRDLRRLWAQSLAIALVMAAGVATLILGAGAHGSLSETRAAYYESNRFGDIFATLTRAPKAVLHDIRTIDGVAAVEGRISKIALADLADMAEPASVRLVSLPDIGPPQLNLLHLRAGRLPEPESEAEAVVSEGFAAAHALTPGHSFRVLINGKMRALRVSGVAISPEFIYILGPGDLMPDERRFGVVWMSEAALAAAFDLEGAFSDVVIRLTPGAAEAAVIERIDTVLARYGGRGATGRKDQLSHAFLDAELKQLQAMSRILPPIFLVVAAFLVNMTLSRLIALEREQIGLLKALGYSAGDIMLHYLQFVAAVALTGVIIGSMAGTWLGQGMARLYAEFFNFPFLIFRRDPGTYAIAAAVTVAAAVAGAIKAVTDAAFLPPAVAMSPPAPARYRKVLGGRFDFATVLRKATVMVSRHLWHWPFRTASSILGTAFAVAILVGTLWSFGSVEFMIDVTFHRADRQDASISFVEAKPASALASVGRLPGVMQTEPFREAAVRIRKAQRERLVGLTGKPAEADLSRVLGLDLVPVTLPETGVALSDMLADVLDARPGDMVEIDVLEGDRRQVTAPVTAVVQGYLGLMAFMDIAALNRLLGEGEMITGMHLAFDESQKDALFAQIKETPSASFIALQRVSLAKFRETLARNLLIMVSVYMSLAAIIAFGVVYNFSRISLSELGREMASLRVLGFTRGEVSALLFTELAIVTLLAQPIGWLIGYGFAYAMVQGFATELYRVPLVVGREVYAYASLVVMTAAAASALVVRRRVDRLDLIAVLKTRE
jgi:putative ABC transport system permease protein